MLSVSDFALEVCSVVPRRLNSRHYTVIPQVLHSLC